MTQTPNTIALTRRQVREVDRRAIEDYGIPGIVLMENAGRNAARIVRERFQGPQPPSTTNRFVAIVCGRGNNGGDGFVIARHLANAEIPVELFCACDPSRLTGDAATNFNIATKMGLTRHAFDTPDRIAAAAERLGKAAIVVDAVLGTGFSGMVRPPLDLVIEAMNQVGAGATGTKIIAIDVPSGLDCDSGLPCNATVRAEATITFVAMKVGFRRPDADAYTGEVHVVDIGAPPRIVQAVLDAGSG